jgi:hypothetical protein
MGSPKKNYYWVDWILFGILFNTRFLLCQKSGYWIFKLRLLEAFCYVGNLAIGFFISTP